MLESGGTSETARLGRDIADVIGMVSDTQYPPRKMSMVTPSKFEVIAWIRETDSFPALRDELLALAGDDPDKSTRYEGMVDFHWGSPN